MTFDFDTTEELNHNSLLEDLLTPFFSIQKKKENKKTKGKQTVLTIYKPLLYMVSSKKIRYRFLRLSLPNPA